MKSTVQQIRERFDNDVERFSHLEIGKTAQVDSVLNPGIDPAILGCGRRHLSLGSAMHHIIQIVSWAVAGGISIILGQTKRLSWKNLSDKINSPIAPEHRFPHKVGQICFICEASLLVWALIYTPWYLALAYPITGVFIWVLIEDRIDPIAVVKYGLYVPIIGSGYLWLSEVVHLPR